MSKLIRYIIDNNLKNEDFTGEVLWYCEREGRGIMLTGSVDHEIYFDRSVLTFNEVPKKGDFLEFNYNTEIQHCACAKNVRSL